MDDLYTRGLIAEYYGLSLDIVKIGSQSDLTFDPNLASAFSIVEETSDNIEVVLFEKRPNSKLAEVNDIRKNSYQALYEYIEGCLKHPSAIIRNNAKKIFEYLENLGGLTIYKSSYVKFTSKISVLISDLSNEKWQTTLTETGDATLFFNDLEGKQDNFLSEVYNYDGLKGEDNTHSNASDLTTTLHYKINTALIGYLNAMMEINPAPYVEIYENVKEAVKSINKNIKLRKTLNEKKKESEKEEKNKTDEVKNAKK